MSPSISWARHTLCGYRANHVVPTGTGNVFLGAGKVAFSVLLSMSQHNQAGTIEHVVSSHIGSMLLLVYKRKLHTTLYGKTSTRCV